MSKQQSLTKQRNYYLEPRHAYEFDTNYREDLGDFEPTRTKQADAQSADINYIMQKYAETGQLPDMIQREPHYGDFADLPSYQEALNTISHAQEQFYALDAKVRARFENDPAQMLEFVQNPANGDELVKMGLAVARPLETTPPASSPGKPKGKTQSPPQEPEGD